MRAERERGFARRSLGEGGKRRTGFALREINFAACLRAERLSVK